jgi:hypothetical protein
MNTPTAGAARRPTLSLNYEPKAHPAVPQRCRRSPVLSTEELRRLVAAMVD